MSELVSQCATARRNRPPRTLAWNTTLVAFIAIALVACAPAAAPTEAPSNDGEAEVVMKNFQFVPAEITVQVGTMVVWSNQDSAPHTVTSGTRDQPTGQFDANVGAGETFSFTFDEPGTYPYYCSIHAGMDGVVTVTE